MKDKLRELLNKWTVMLSDAEKNYQYWKAYYPPRHEEEEYWAAKAGAYMGIVRDLTKFLNDSESLDVE